MSIEQCTWCKNKGFTCERPLTIGAPKARMIRTLDNRQFITLQAIEDCKTRKSILEAVQK